MLVKRIMAAVLCVCVVVGIIGGWSAAWAWPADELEGFGCHDNNSKIDTPYAPDNVEVYVSDGYAAIWIRGGTAENVRPPLIPSTEIRIEVEGAEIYWTKIYDTYTSNIKHENSLYPIDHTSFRCVSRHAYNESYIPILLSLSDNQCIDILLPDGGAIYLYGHKIDVPSKKHGSRVVKWVGYWEFVEIANNHMNTIHTTGNIQITSKVIEASQDTTDKGEPLEVVNYKFSVKEGLLPNGTIDIYQYDRGWENFDPKLNGFAYDFGLGYAVHDNTNTIMSMPSFFVKARNILGLPNADPDPSAGQSQSQTRPAALTRVKAVVTTGVATAAIAGAVIYFTPFRRRKKEEGKEAVNNEDDA